MRGAVSKGGSNASPAVERKEGKEKSKRARRRKPETAKTDLKPSLSWFLGGQGVRSDPESEGFEERYRAVINGATPTMNRSAKDGARSSPHYGGEGVTHSPIVPRCLLTARYGRFMRDPRRPVCVPATNRVSDLTGGTSWIVLIVLKVCCFSIFANSMPSHLAIAFRATLATILIQPEGPL
jgi:hypothetical protein